jgi:hypothetical protein
MTPNTPNRTIVTRQDLAVGVLSVTAVLLLVGVLVVQTISAPAAHAFAQTAQSGDYLVATGQFQESVEYIYVVDAAAQRLIAYRYDYNRKKIDAVDGFDLKKLAPPAAGRTP